MAESMLASLLKTPQQVREEQEAKLRQNAMQRASAIQAPAGAATALPGIYANIGRREAVSSATDMADIFRRSGQAGRGLLQSVGAPEGLSRAVGQVGVSPEERQAGQTQGIMAGLDQTDPKSYAAVAQRLKDQGLLQASMEITKQGRALEASQTAAARQKRLDAEKLAKDQSDLALKSAEIASEAFEKQKDRELKAQELELKRTQADQATELFDMEKNKIENIVGLSLKDATIKSQAAAKAVHAAGKLKGETDGLFQARIASKLVDIDRRTTVNNLSEANEREFEKAEGKRYSKTLGEVQEKTERAQRSMLTIKEGQRLLDEGIITGFGGKLTLDYIRAKKFFNLADADEKELLVRTETYIVTMAQEVLGILGSGDLGAGTGLSDKDVQFAKDVVAGDIALDADTMKTILSAARRARTYQIIKHNEFAAKVNAKYEAGIEEINYAGRTATDANGNQMIYVEGPDGNGWQRQNIAAELD